MGTISKRISRGEVVYQAKVRRIGFPALSRTFPEKRLAEAWIQEQELAQSRGSFIDPASARTTTLGTLLDRYEGEVTPRKRGAEVEGFHLRALKRSKLAEFAVGNLSAEAVRQYRDERLCEVAGSTVNRELGILHHVLEHARKEWDIGFPRNPVSDVARAKNPPARDRRLSTEEEAALLAACDRSKGGFLRDIVSLAIETGMRQGELVGLVWERVDFERRTIRLLLTKNGEGRGVPISSRAAAVLRSREKPSGSQGAVFEGVTTSAVKQAFQNAVRRAGLADLRFHDLRHEATSRFFEIGLNSMEAAAITGHKDLRMLKRYTHLDASRLAARLG